MTILSGLDESYDNVFYTLIEIMLSPTVTLDDAKLLLLSHESKLDRCKSLAISRLPSVNLTVKNSSPQHIQNCLINALT